VKKKTLVAVVTTFWNLVWNWEHGSRSLALPFRSAERSA